MRWTERQRAMLREMGIHLWAAETVQETVDAPTEARQTSEAPAPSTRSAPPPPASSRGDGSRVASTARAAEPAPRWPGLAPADWLVVSEPLDAGDPQQEQLLENMLRAIGVGVVAPSRERRAAFFPLLDAADEGGAPALPDALATVAPRGILAFGRAAAAALLGDDVPLGGLRGRVHAYAGVPVVVTFSLAFLLRHPAEKAKAWADLCLAVGAPTR